MSRFRTPGAPDHGRSYHNDRNAATFRPFGVVLILGALLLGGRAAAASTAVVATEHRLATAAGVEILRAGGNAVDAAVAAAAASGVLNPASCGIGGGGFMLAYEKKGQTAHLLDYREVAPAAATLAAFDARGVSRITSGAVSVGVPGSPAGLVAAHARLGSLPLSVVLDPAIRYARDGFAIEGHLAKGIERHQELLRGDPALRHTFLHADDRPRQRGEQLRQPDLALSLERLVREGTTPFYRGTIAAAIARTLSERGGFLTTEDLGRYRVRWRRPLRGRYRGRTVFTTPPPGSGGVLLAALNVLGGYDLRALGLGSPTYLHLLADTMKAVFADRARYYGDPDFVEVPVRRLTSDAHARSIRKRLSATRVLDVTAAEAVDAGTSHVSVVDGAGNAAAITYTINTSFGAGIVAAGTGIILNNEMADFNLTPGGTNVFGLVGTAANVVEPGKRPLSSMIPTIVLRGHTPEIVIGASGGPTIITGVLQTLLALIDFGLGPADAVRTPRIHHQGIPPTLLVETAIPKRTLQSLGRLGHETRTVDSLSAVSVVHFGSAGAGGAGAVRKGGAAEVVELAR
jgi:gamma-glutamyltranspeptidase/glutathione hydrolase